LAEQELFCASAVANTEHDIEYEPVGPVE